MRTTTTEELEALADRATRGDRQATETLLRALATRVIGLTRHLLGPAHPDVEDAAQESLIELAKALPSYRAEGSITAFANRITARTTLHIARRNRANLAQRGKFESELAPTPPPTAADLAAASHRREAIRRSLSVLPPEQAETIALRVCLGESLEAGAEHTGVPINTVRSRVRLAKEGLRRRLVRMNKEDES